jgi:hypothetical protein
MKSMGSRQCQFGFKEIPLRNQHIQIVRQAAFVP